MKSLLNNQECRIDNHNAGQIINGLNGLHIHKTYKKNKIYSNATIRIPLDGKNVKWQCTGENANKLRKECEQALSNPLRNKEFVNVVINEMSRFNNPLNSKDVDDLNKQIAESVLSRGFLINNLKYETLQRKNVFGKQMKYFIFCNHEFKYFVFLGKTRFIFKGEENKKNIR